MDGEEGERRTMRDMLDYLAGQSSPERAELIRKQLNNPSSQERELLGSIQAIARSAFRDKILERASNLDRILDQPLGGQAEVSAANRGGISKTSDQSDWSQRLKGSERGGKQHDAPG